MAPNTLTIAEAHEQLKGKKISSAELTQACIDRIEKVDGTLNATVFRNFERALEEAKKIDTKGEFTHPLSGIPYLTKDVFCEKGVPTTGCSNVLRRKDYIPAFDSTTTKRLKAAGALSLGKTNTDEFTMGASTETSCYGVTRCPWDTKRVAGGSSGGAAVRLRDGTLAGIIVTETTAASTGERDLRALALSHIDDALIASGNGGIVGLLVGDLSAKAVAFNSQIAPSETALLEAVLNGN